MLHNINIIIKMIKNNNNKIYVWFLSNQEMTLFLFDNVFLCFYMECNIKWVLSSTNYIPIIYK